MEEGKKNEGAREEKTELGGDGGANW